MVAGALLGVAVAAGVLAGSMWMVAGEEELPAMPAEAEAALEAQPEPQDSHGWRRELGEPLDKPVAFHPADDRAHTMYPFGMRADQWRQELPA